MANNANTNPYRVVGEAGQSIIVSFRGKPEIEVLFAHLSTTKCRLHQRRYLLHVELGSILNNQKIKFGICWVVKARMRAVSVGSNNCFAQEIFTWCLEIQFALMR
jgi:hypothetical protein